MATSFLFPAMAMAVVVIIFLQTAENHGEINMVFYLHDKVEGKNVTAIAVAGLNGTSSWAGKFGTVIAISDVITERPHFSECDADSANIVGRAKGAYVNTNLVTGADFLMVFTIVFQNTEYDGSTLEIQGTDRYLSPHRELAVVGGTGKFRFARGYVVVTTESLSGQNVSLKLNTTIRLN